MKSVCVYCGSSRGISKDYGGWARNLGGLLARQNIDLIYGGGNIGIMYEVAKATLEGGGSVTGVITRQLVEMKVALRELSDLRIVESMHERKALMEELAEGFIALPGGFGTMEELFEILTWAQLGLHQKPCAMLNIDGYYNKLWQFIEHMSQEGFLQREYLDLVLIDDSPQQLLDKMQSYQPILVDKGVWARQASCLSEG